MTEKLFYRLGIKRWYWPFHIRYDVYRHEVEPDVQRLVFYKTDNSVVSLPIDGLCWKVYPEYWEVSKNYARLQQQDAPN